MSLRTAVLQLYVYSGTEGAQTSSDLKYTIEKEIIDGDTKILFEIGELVRDYIDITFNDDYVCNTKWVTAITTLYDENNEIFTYSNPVTNHYLALNTKALHFILNISSNTKRNNCRARSIK